MDVFRVEYPPTGDWRSGSAAVLHTEGHWFEPSIAHHSFRRSGHVPGLFVWGLRTFWGASAKERATGANPRFSSH